MFNMDSKSPALKNAMAKRRYNTVVNFNLRLQATLPAASTKTLTAAWLEVFDEIPFTEYSSIHICGSHIS